MIGRTGIGIGIGIAIGIGIGIGVGGCGGSSTGMDASAMIDAAPPDLTPHAVVWSPAQSPTAGALFCVFGVSAKELWLGGELGQIFHTSDGGATWSKGATNVMVGIASIWGTGDELFAVGGAGTILHSSDRGATWVKMSSGTSYDLNQVWGAAVTDVYVAGNNADILHYDGASWDPSLAASPPAANIYGVIGFGAGDAFAVGRGAIDHSTDHGRTWTNLYGGADVVHKIWGPSIDDLIVLALGGIQRSTDRGKTWMDVSSVTALQAVWGSSADDVYAVGDAGAILRSADGGATWTPQTSGTTQPLDGVWGSGEGDVWAVGANGTLLHGR